MYSTPDEIKTAVEAYRSHIAGHNRRIIEVYVKIVVNAVLDPDDWGDVDPAEQKVAAFDGIFSSELREYVSVPEDVLTHYDILASLSDLDGCGGPAPSSDEDAVAQRESYFSSLERGLKEKCTAEFRDTITVPPELRLLAEQVNALTGPGIGERKSMYQAMFWTGTYYDAAAVKTPEELTCSIDACWDCAAGWEPGAGVECFFYIVYCRRECERHESRPWGWRYMAMGMYDSEVFDTIPELLAWYCRYREREVPEVHDLREEDVLEGWAL